MDMVCDEELKYNLEYEELIKYTENFSDENYVGNFQFGKVYRGKIKQSTHEIRHVLVKIFEESTRYAYNQGDNETRLMQEITLLRHEKLKSNPGRIELYGYCWDNEHLGVVYNLKPLDTLHNLAPKDSFTWLQRIKVAIGFARLLKFLHMGDPAFKPILVRNIAAAHIILDEEYNPRLFDFSMISGGMFTDRTVNEYYRLNGSIGYIDYCTVMSSNWSQINDVFAFGILLLNLITKSMLIKENLDDDSYLPLDEWAYDNYKGSKSEDRADKLLSSFVDSSLEIDPEFSYSDGHKITKLAMSCIQKDPSHRPLMKQVVKILRKLQVVKKHTKFLGLD